MGWSLLLPFVLFAVGMVTLLYFLWLNLGRRVADLCLWGSLLLELSRGDHRAFELGAVSDLPRR